MTRILILVVVVVFLVVYYAVRAGSNHFECPECGEHFQVNVFKYMFAPHIVGKRRVTCPKCGKASMLYPEEGKR